MIWEKFFYKISKDILISLIITYFLVFIPELILPGIVSSHFSPKLVLVLIMAAAILHVWLARNIFAPKENVRFRAISKNLLNGILAVISIMLVLSLYKMKIWQIAVVTALSIILLVATEKMMISGEKTD